MLQVYIVVSILKHLQQDILTHRQTQDLQVFLKESPLTSYQMSNYMDYMQTLQKKYRSTIQPSMKSIFKNKKS